MPGIGGFIKQYQVEVDPLKLQAYGSEARFLGQGIDSHIRPATTVDGDTVSGEEAANFSGCGQHPISRQVSADDTDYLVLSYVHEGILSSSCHNILRLGTVSLPTDERQAGKGSGRGELFLKG